MERGLVWVQLLSLPFHLYNAVISGADSIGHGGTCPHFYKWLGTGGIVSRITANNKLTKLY